MKIVEVKARRLVIDSGPWFGGETPPGQPRSFQFPLLELVTDEGLCGYSTGYCPLGQGRGATQQLIDVYSRLLVGRDPSQIEAIWHELQGLGRHLYTMTDAAFGQVDVALWDLRGKALGRSIATLLGQARSSVPTYGTGSYFLSTPEEAAREVRRIRDLGYRGAKLNLTAGPAKDIPRLEAARAAVGPEYPLMLDACSALTFTQALEIGHVLERLHYAWFEEPLYDRQLGQLRALREALDVPLIGAETISLLELGQVFSARVFDVVRGDVYIKCGVTGLMKVIAMAEVFGVEVEIHACASPLLDVANLHVACATGSTRWLEVHHEMFRFGLRDNPMQIDSTGLLKCPTAPGLGVTLDWDWIDDHTAEVVVADPLA